MFTAAVEDRIIAENPCRARSVRAPRLAPRKIKLWTADRVMQLHESLLDQNQEMTAVGAGCGLWQGEIFGLAVDDIDFLGGTLHVVRQVKLLQGSRPVFGPPKGGEERDVPLPETVAFALAAHITRHPSMQVTLPWKTLDGPTATASLIFVTAGVPFGRDNGMHALRTYTHLMPSSEARTRAAVDRVFRGECVPHDGPETAQGED
ncbi:MULTISPECIES: hypothetical protein [Streptomyces]|uniref:Tyr recombinase domain-containing protein n=1 Tax=Streptomyces doudnae TaxID=3075536 RepID=A0ABD5ESX0_9ACTN|nr:MULTISPECIES: hypothetical protein [unclassified Streptomyces]MDT0437710.1 hypothetical protein [Streptomyces sp. DSM 41981]